MKLYIKNSTEDYEEASSSSHSSSSICSNGPRSDIETFFTYTVVPACSLADRYVIRPTTGAVQNTRFGNQFWISGDLPLLDTTPLTLIQKNDKRLTVVRDQVKRTIRIKIDQVTFNICGRHNTLPDDILNNIMEFSGDLKYVALKVYSADIHPQKINYYYFFIQALKWNAARKMAHQLNISTMTDVDLLCTSLGDLNISCCQKLHQAIMFESFLTKLALDCTNSQHPGYNLSQRVLQRVVRINSWSNNNYFIGVCSNPGNYYLAVNEDNYLARYTTDCPVFWVKDCVNLTMECAFMPILSKNFMEMTPTKTNFLKLKINQQ
jgi:hypothetical protein